MLTRGFVLALLLLALPPQPQPRFPTHVETSDYPPRALKARVTGDVEVVAQVDSQGRVIGAPKATTGPRRLRRAAEENMKTWRFQPGGQGSVKVTYHYTILGGSIRGYVWTQYKFDLPDSVTVVASQAGPSPSLPSTPKPDSFPTVSPAPHSRSPVHVESVLYPRLAFMARIQGDIVVVALVGADGHVIGVPNAPAGHPLLAEAAEGNIGTWIFQPGAEEEVKVTYHFRVDGTLASSDGPGTFLYDPPDSVTVTVAPPVININYSSEQKPKSN